MSDFKLEFDAKKMNAYLTIPVPAADDEITYEQILEYLVRSGIVFGMKKDTVRRMLDRNLWDRRIKIASGRNPVNGENGRTKFHFKTDFEIKPKILPDGSVDYRDLQLAQNVTVGQVVAERIPPTEGEPGMDIIGKEIPSKAGVPALLRAGKNTEFRDEKEMILVSEVDGSVKLHQGNRVVVDTVFRVEGDVDFSTGDLDVIGDVNVGGNIISGFSVKATGNVVVNGIVEDAVVEAGGDVLVRRGFVGAGKGRISAGGKVVIKFISNQTVHDGDDIQIGEEAFHATLIAGKSIVINRGFGALIGGEARAGEYVEVKTSGSDQHINTLIVVAECDDMSEKINLLNKEISDMEKELTDVKERMMAITEGVGSSGLSINRKRFLNSLERDSRLIDERKKNTEEERSELEEKIEALEQNTYVSIMDRIYPKSIIQIGWLRRSINNARGASEFRMGDGRIVVS